MDSQNRLQSYKSLEEIQLAKVPSTSDIHAVSSFEQVSEMASSPLREAPALRNEFGELKQAVTAQMYQVYQLMKKMPAIEASTAFAAGKVKQIWAQQEQLLQAIIDSE
ncbi:Hypothetical_protein [Hexamita inflata]|uniref:Hypothetical_protein n=1 Tax=Hexamita inflata TaxID=28002 RepID=A0AA86P8N0_9EUKA|nr:Hypothetical protein HINF_LOCUS21478 [Hexamita inflata]CAI9973518.1 Hypothetical protein HINF_LOCUS61163 [Hexamita inflata]